MRVAQHDARPGLARVRRCAAAQAHPPPAAVARTLQFHVPGAQKLYREFLIRGVGGAPVPGGRGRLIDRDGELGSLGRVRCDLLGRSRWVKARYRRSRPRASVRYFTNGRGAQRTEGTGSVHWTHVVVVGLAALGEEGFGVGAEVQQLRGVSVHRVELPGRGHARGGAALAVPHAARSRVPRRTLSGGAMAARGRMLPSGVNASAIYRPWDIDLWRLVGSRSWDGYRENGCAGARVLPVMRDETGTRVTRTLVC